MVGRPLTLLHYYSPALMLHTMHAPELLSFADLFHHQPELGEDSAQIDVSKLTASGSLATLLDYCLMQLSTCSHILLGSRVSPRGKPTLDQVQFPHIGWDSIVYLHPGVK